MTTLEWLLGLGLVLGIFLIRGKLLARGIAQYDAATVSRKLQEKGSILLLDVRSAAERKARSIGGSMHIPLQELRNRLPELERSRDCEIVCYCASGARSLSACQTLKRAGFRTANLSGGISAWKEGA